MISVAYRGFDPRLFQTLLGNARSVSDEWADLLEPWQPDLEKLQNRSGPPLPSLHNNPKLAGVLPASPSDLDGANQSNQPTTRQVAESSVGVLTAGQSKFLSDGTETFSDALPDPVVVGQQYAAGGSSGRPPRRGGGPPEGPVGRFISQVYEAKLRTLAELDPNNPLLTTIHTSSLKN
jgi:ABC-type transporter Mla subunit MlaD